MKTNKLILSCFIVSAVILFNACGNGIKDQDGNSCKVAKIGTQQWMTENLNVSHFRNGDVIPEAKTKEDWESAGREGKAAWCYYDNKFDKKEKKGKLYNWYAVIDARGLAPAGFHIPNETDWNALTVYLGGESSAGKKMKDKIGWTNEGNGTNESGFSAVPGGFRFVSGYFISGGDSGFWWSSIEINKGLAWVRGLSYQGNVVGKSDGGKGNGFSVRCIKD